MGMASGVFEADLQRAKLRQQAANDAASHALKWRQQQLEERRYEDKRKAQEREEALEKERYERRQKLYEQELQAKGAREDRKLDYEMRRQDRLDALAERKYALQEAEQQAKYEKQRAVYDGYAQLGKQAKQQQLARQESGASALASVMKLAMNNGGTNAKTGKKSKGMIPRYGLEALNRDMGFDGQNQGFVSGGFTTNGDFFLQYAQKDPQTGQMVTTPQVITPVDQFKIMNRQRGIFTNQDLGEMAAQLKQSGYRDDEIMLASGVDQLQLEQIKNAEKQVKAQKAAGNSGLKSALEAIKMLSEYREKNKDMLKDYELNDLNESIKNMMTDVTQTINQSYLQKRQAQQMQAAKDAGKPVYDAQKNTLTMPDGTTLQKNQEWVDPETGEKFVWKGDGAKNFESLSPNNNSAANGAQPQAQQEKQASDEKYGPRQEFVGGDWDLTAERNPDGSLVEHNQDGSVKEPDDYVSQIKHRWDATNPMNAQYDNDSYEEYKKLQSSGVLSSDVDMHDYMRMKEQGVDFSTELKQLEKPQYTAGEGMSNVNDTSIAGYTKNIYNKLSNSGLLDTSKLGFKDFADLVGMSDEDMAYFDKQKLVSGEPEKQKMGATGISAKKDPNWPPSPDTEMGKKYYQATKAEKEKFWNDVANMDSLYNKFVNNGAIDRNKVGLADFANLMGYSEDEKADMHKPKLEARRPETDEESEEVYEYPDEMADHFKKLQEEEEMNEQAEHVKDWEFNG